MKKDFGKDDNDGKEAQTWQNREKDWYNAERRFIFASETDKMKNKWIEKILTDQIKKSLKQNIAMMFLKNKKKKNQAGANETDINSVQEE